MEGRDDVYGKTLLCLYCMSASLSWFIIHLLGKKSLVLYILVQDIASRLLSLYRSGFRFILDFISKHTHTHTQTQSVVNLFISVQPPLVAIRGFSRDSCLAARLPPCTECHTHTHTHTHTLNTATSPARQSCHSNRLSEIKSKGQVKGEEIKSKDVSCVSGYNSRVCLLSTLSGSE